MRLDKPETLLQSAFPSVNKKITKKTVRRKKLRPLGKMRECRAETGLPIRRVFLKNYRLPPAAGAGCAAFMLSVNRFVIFPANTVYRQPRQWFARRVCLPNH